HGRVGEELLAVRTGPRSVEVIRDEVEARRGTNFRESDRRAQNRGGPQPCHGTRRLVRLHEATRETLPQGRTIERLDERTSRDVCGIRVPCADRAPEWMSGSLGESVAAERREREQRPIVERTERPIVPRPLEPLRHRR